MKSTKNLIANDTTNKLKPLEENEFILYQVQLFIDSEKYDDAITLLD